MVQSRNAGPEINWDGKTIFVKLPVEDGRTIEAKWNPNRTYVIRVREAGASEWNFGVETPLTGCTFVDLKPDTEYEVQVRAKGTAGEGKPTLLKMRTNPKGGGGNIVPFPSKPRR